jgi:hypothetical protein
MAGLAIISVDTKEKELIGEFQQRDVLGARSPKRFMSTISPVPLNIVLCHSGSMTSAAMLVTFTPGFLTPLRSLAKNGTIWG